MKSKSHLALVVFAALVGLAVRLGPALAADFPLNDGGLFFAMIRALQANGYALPAFASYNGAQIPFAYPPLGFYLTGLLSDLARAGLLDVMRLLPAIVSALTIPAFYRLARGFASPTAAALATLLFALTPRAFAWHIMGGGVTRALGFLFALLTLEAAHRLFTAPSRRLLFWTSICAALTIVTHPEAATQTAFAALLLYLFFDRSRAGLLRALAVALLALALTSPWWVTVLSRHGLDPFLAASSAVRADSVPLIARLFLLFQFQFTEEPFLPLVAILGVVGLFLHLAKRERFLPSWLALTFLFEPRSAPLYMTLP
ncbi:MAG: glycosyltransferase family 39 protein, partial [Chloroflexota bacterium]